MWLTITTIVLSVLVLINAFMVVALWGLAIKVMKLSVDKHIITVEAQADGARKELELLQERAEKLIATMNKVNDIAGGSGATPVMVNPAEYVKRAQTTKQGAGRYDCQAG